MSEQEEWRPVPAWVGLYEVSSEGNIRSVDRRVEAVWGGRTAYSKSVKGRTLKLATNRDGYLAGCLCVDNQRTNFELHTLVCRAFHGEPAPGKQVAHNNGVRTDCRAVNLRWVSAQENAADRQRHGRHPGGEKNPRALLTENQVREIRASTQSSRALAREYRVSRGAITGILSRKNWPNVR